MRRAVLTLLCAFAALVVLAGPAAAQTANGGDDVVAPVWVIPAPTITLLMATVLPALNGLLLRPENPQWVKSLVANGLAAIAYAIEQAIVDGGAAALTEAWFHGLLATLVAMTFTYLGLWKPILDPNRNAPTPLPLGNALASATHTERRAA